MLIQPNILKAPQRPRVLQHRAQPDQTDRAAVFIVPPSRKHRSFIYETSLAPLLCRFYLVVNVRDLSIYLCGNCDQPSPPPPRRFVVIVTTHEIVVQLGKVCVYSSVFDSYVMVASNSYVAHLSIC